MSRAESTNQYGDLVERWKVELIGRRARRFGFRRDDIPDLEQRIVTELLDVSFEESGTASEATFTASVIDRLLTKELRDRRRHVRRVNLEACSWEGVAEPVSSCPADSISHAMLRLDLETALAKLPGEERAVCEMLRRGYTQAEIAHSFGKSESTVCRAVRTIRERLSKLGLDTYLGKARTSTQGSGDSR